MPDDSREMELEARRAEIVKARERVATALERLTSPETKEALKSEVLGHVEGYKAELLAKADQFKDEILERLRDTSERTTRTFVQDVTARARDNPWAVMLIGAGLGWRLFTRPPVTALLMGAGIALLMREREATVAAPAARKLPALGPTGDAVMEQANAMLQKAQRNPAIVAGVGFAAGAALAGLAAARTSIGRGIGAAASHAETAARPARKTGPAGASDRARAAEDASAYIAKAYASRHDGTGRHSARH